MSYKNDCNYFKIISKVKVKTILGNNPLRSGTNSLKENDY